MYKYAMTNSTKPSITLISNIYKQTTIFGGATTATSESSGFRFGKQSRTWYGFVWQKFRKDIVMQVLFHVRSVS